MFMDVSVYGEELDETVAIYTDPPAARPTEPVKAITPLMEQQMFDDWCPYKGSPNPRTVWAAAVDAVNGILLGAAKPAAQQQDPSAQQLRIADLESQVSKLTQALADPMTTGIAIGNGSMDVGLHGGGAQLLAGMFVGMLDANAGAVNYIELQFGSPRGPIVVTVMRPDGKTPHQLRQDAEQRIVDLDAEVARFRADAMNERSARRSLEQQLAARAPLTDDELWSLWNSQADDAMDQVAAIAFARAIEAAHGIAKGST
jgi:hypothetical protein